MALRARTTAATTTPAHGWRRGAVHRPRWAMTGIHKTAPASPSHKLLRESCQNTAIARGVDPTLDREACIGREGLLRAASIQTHGRPRQRRHAHSPPGPQQLEAEYSERFKCRHYMFPVQRRKPTVPKSYSELPNWEWAGLYGVRAPPGGLWRVFHKIQDEARSSCPIGLWTCGLWPRP
jgi:hypothetical protein